MKIGLSLPDNIKGWGKAEQNSLDLLLRFLQVQFYFLFFYIQEDVVVVKLFHEVILNKVNTCPSMLMPEEAEAERLM